MSLLQAPFLAIAGTKDETVSPQVVRSIYEAANEPKQYLEFPADHRYKHDSELLRLINAATVEFFVQNLSTSASN